MRYGADQKEATRRRIIAAAGERFKTDGMVASGIATLMADAGLTNGAFYAHFASKDDLVTTTVTEQLADARARFDTDPEDPATLERSVRAYLSRAHRDDPAHGCPSAALLEEIGRCGAETRDAYTTGLLTSLEALATTLADGDPERGRVRAVGLFAMMAGALQAARAVSDPELSDAVLEQGIENVLVVARQR